MILIDIRISVKVFIDIFFALYHKLFMQKLQNLQMLQLADDSFISVRTVHERAILNFKIHQHSERVSDYLMKLNFFISIILDLE